MKVHSEPRFCYFYRAKGGCKFGEGCRNIHNIPLTFEKGGDHIGGDFTNNHYLRILSWGRCWEGERASKVEFPKPTGININMMPFVSGDLSTIPDEFRGYDEIIQLCLRDLRLSSDSPAIFYLTIQESFVEPGSCQRRPGLHTDMLSTLTWGELTKKGGGTLTGNSWGGSVQSLGGIFLASNVADSCRAWDARVDYPGLLGDCSGMREALGEGTMLEANHLYWITDRTPHEALPMAEGGHRQFFRLVTDNVDVWYTQHSTSNPLGVKPPMHVKIVTENKFDPLADGDRLK